MGSSFSGCLRCIIKDNQYSCIECQNNHESVIANGNIIRCTPKCNYDSLTNVITADSGISACNINSWANSQLDVPAYDMISLRSPTTDLELNALKNFYTAFNGNIWTSNRNWNAGDPCLVSQLLYKL